MSARVTQVQKTKAMLLRPEMVLERFSVSWYNITPQKNYNDFKYSELPLLVFSLLRQARMEVKVKFSNHE